MQDAGEHIRLAIGAMALGMLSHAELSDALITLFNRDEPCGIAEFWVQSGLLDAAQIERAVAVLDRGKTELAARRDESSAVEPPGKDDHGKTELAPGLAPIARTLHGSSDQLLLRPGPARVPAPSPSPPMARVQGSGTGKGKAGQTLTRASAARAETATPETSAPSATRYEHRHWIGAGGSGQVSEAYDRVLRRAVALKSVLDERTSRATEETLMAEAQLTSGLEHPNIIPVYDAHIDSEGRSFYVMRLIDEPDLDEILCRIGEGDEETRKTFTLGRLLRDFMQVCQAVQYAHSRGIVHCDLKPQNIVLGPFGEVLVLDWGLAHNVDSKVVARGGTPGFMAPEQVDPNATSFDARTDVFAMGAILYKILTGESAFEVETIAGYLKLLRRGAQGEPVIIEPSKRCPDRVIPEELSDVCMKALAMPLRQRLGSVRELGEAIEAFLDRTEDLKRRRSEAKQHIETGDELSARYHEFAESQPEQMQELVNLRAATHPWDPLEKKSELWDAEALVNVTTLLRIRTLQAAVASYEQALELLPNHALARWGLARLYWAELRDAKQRRDEANQTYFEGLVRRYDDGRLADALDAPATLQVRCDSRVPATLSVATLAEQGRRWVVVDELALERQQAPVQLRAGQYALRVQHDTTEIRFPLNLEAGEKRDVTVDTRILRKLDADEVYVPGGATLIAVNPADPASTALYEAEVGAFAIRRFPVTFAEYLRFLDDVRDSDRDISQLIPGDRKGSPYWRWQGSWEPTRMPGPSAVSDKLRLPAFGVTAIAAEAFADWLSQKTGRSYRLPRNSEWEKAGRGTDGRAFPWGDHFDALFCKMRDSRAGLPAPEPVGTFENDISPYGVRDLAGTIAEWVLPDHGYLGTETEKRYYSRGGAWCDWEIDCGLGRRRIYFARERSARVGFRLVRELASALSSHPTPVPTPV